MESTGFNVLSGANLLRVSLTLGLNVVYTTSINKKNDRERAFARFHPASKALKIARINKGDAK